jgi:hypothetical protein
VTDGLTAFVARELARAVPPEIAGAAAHLADELGGVAVLFYGSVLRTGDLDGVLDFYVLTPAATGTPLRRLGLRWLWPDVSFHEIAVGARTLRAKVATMPLATFARAARGGLTDTTIWTRFVQPAACAWSADAAIRQRVIEAVADAAVTAARFAAVLGPRAAAPLDYWAALFRHTYRAELRVEAPGRERAILDVAPSRYQELLTLAWAAGGTGFDRKGAWLQPRIDPAERRRLTRAWRRRARAGKPLNVARLVKAAFTFEGAARYGLWKVKRHTGVDLPLTPFRERHPVLAAPGVFWRVMRERSR